MTRFTKAAGRWARDRQADAVIQSIQRAPDRAAAVSLLRDKIDDRVIGGLTDLSYIAWRNGDHTESRAWADLAVQASLLGGTSSGRADALMRLVIVTLEDTQRDDAVDRAQLDAAESAAREAMAIYTDAGQADERLSAQLFIARLRQAGGDIFGAFEAQLRGVRLAAETADRQQRAGVFRLFCPLYWGLPEDRQYAGAELLVRDIGTLLGVAPDQRILADLLDAAGDAHRQLRSPGGDAAFKAWAHAATLYHELGDVADEFLVRNRMFEYAAQLGEFALARELGQACVQSAPPDVPPEQLAGRYHLLGVTYSVLDQVEDAITAYRHAITLELSHAEGSGKASTLFLELGLVEADAARYDDARSDLERVTSGGAWDHWLREATLADICYQHLGDLGGALAYGEAALQYSISILGNMTCRAYSLYQEGTLRFAAGDMEAAYRRFSQLMPILAQPLEPILVRISLLFERPVVPPSRAECAWLACRVCEATGRQEEAQAYRQMHADLAGSDSANLVPAELAAEANLDDLAALDVVRKLKYAMSLMRAQPLEALTVLASARAALTGDGEPRLAARLDYAEGSCHLLLRDYPAAAAEFEQALAALPDRTDAAVQIDCHQGLAFIAAADGRYADAYEHLRECVKLIERYRTSLPRVEDRMAFLRDRIPIYELLVRCCIALNLRVEAFTAVQRVKSRSLADLLAQPAHQPIDYALEGQAALLRTDREDWVAEHIGDTYTWGQDFGDPEEYEKSREYQMLTRSIRRSEQEKDLVEERHVRGLLEKLQEQATELDFTVVRELLRM